MFSNGKIDFECIVPSYRQSRAEAFVFDSVIWSFLLEFLFDTSSRRASPGNRCHRWQPINCIFGFCFAYRFPNLREFIITVVVRFKIGANMNLAVANPGQRPGANPADWIASFLIFDSSSVASFECAIVFASRRRRLFCFVLISSRLLISCFRKLKPILFQNSLVVFVLHRLRI